MITIGIDPTIELGPVSLAWHGMTIAAGLATGGWLAARYARERRLDSDEILSLVLVIGLVGILGARLLYLVENDADAPCAPATGSGVAAIPSTER